MGNKGRGEKTKMNKGRREGQGERANNNKEFSYVFVWCLFRSLIGPKSGQNPKKKKHPNLQPHDVFFFSNFEEKKKEKIYCSKRKKGWKCGVENESVGETWQKKKNEKWGEKWGENWWEIKVGRDVGMFSFFQFLKKINN